MKKLLGSALLGLGLLAGTAQAGYIVDTVDQTMLMDAGDHHSYTHNLNDDGFVLGSALSGTLKIHVADDNEGWDEKFPWEWESILFIVEDFDFDTGGFTFGTTFYNELEFEALAAINMDGYLDVTVKAITGDFWLGDSILKVKTADVPGPGVLGLMVIGLAGLGLSRRKQAMKQA